MCGIVGILGFEPVATDLVEGLRRLEYRGYDSAGIATLENGVLTRARAQGKLKNLDGKLQKHPLSGHIGIGHTRWATHGMPTEDNAHPHRSDNIAVVHNGIIENFRPLREALMARGRKFTTQTDTEVVVHLVAEVMASGAQPLEAVEIVLPMLKGAFALVFLFEGEEDLLIGARLGAPLAVGYGQDFQGDARAMYLGSDALALAPFTNEIAYLDDGDHVIVTRKGAEFRDSQNRLVKRPIMKSQASAFLVDKANYRHFMAKEIHEQPEVVGRTLAHYLDMAEGIVDLPFALPVNPADLTKLTICACGTAFMAGLTAKYWFERIAKLPVDIDVASEFRYRETPLEAGGLMLCISQSGETADTLASLRYAKDAGQKTLSVVNVASATIARESDCVVQTLAGPEIGVASTKAFTCQLAALAALAIAFGRARGVLSQLEERALVAELIAVPAQMNEVLRLESKIEALCHQFTKVRNVLYMGRGTSYPLALEGALKLKELSYIHAEGYAAGELKHGPIALIDEEMPVIVLAPYDAVFEKTVSNMQEVAARGGKITLISTSAGADEADVALSGFIPMPPVASAFSALLYALPMQMIAYHTAVLLGKDADQPRNLAKSVTVE